MSESLLTLGALARLGVLFAALGCASVSTTAGAAGAISPREALARSSDQLIVRFREGTAGAQAEDAQTLVQLHAAAARAGVHATVVRRTWNNAVVLKLDRYLPDDVLQTLAREIRETDADVQFAEPDRIKHAAAGPAPNDPYYSLQWNYYDDYHYGGYYQQRGIALEDAWALSNGAGIVVAVLDSGYLPHVDLVDNVIGGYDFVSDPDNARDGTGRDAVPLDPGDWTDAGDCNGSAGARNSSWHGTHVAGIIAAVTNNGVGIAGVAYGAKVMPVRVLGKCGGYDSDITDAIVWAAGGNVSGVPANPNPARVLNLSLSGFGACTSSYQSAIDSARSRGAVVVVAAGNDRADVSEYSPANCHGAISVGAFSRYGLYFLTSYSNRGFALQIAAPGGDPVGPVAEVYSTSNGGAHAPSWDTIAPTQGTSMAAAHVAGVAALMFARNPSLTPNRLLERMRSSVRTFKYSCSYCGPGILDAYWSVYMATAAVMSESESNDTLATAQRILPPTATVAGTIPFPSDVDYYKVEVGPNMQVRASLSPAAGPRDFNLVLYSADGHPSVWSARPGNETDRIVFANTGVTAMVIYLKILFGSGSPGSYMLSIAQYQAS